MSMKTINHNADNSDPIHINVTHVTDEANNGNCEGWMKYYYKHGKVGPTDAAFTT